jgi:diacylglycerol kinase
VLALTIVLVLSLELANTAAERIMDILKPRVHPYARVVKDAMAGAVLIASVGAVFIGICILLPYF